LNETSAIEIKNIHKRFSQNLDKIFNGISFKICPRKSTFILGPSGTGKSVLLKHVTGLIAPDEGEIYIFNEKLQHQNTQKLARIRKTFGVLFQGAALFDSMTVFENIAFPLKEEIRKMKAPEIEARVREKLISVGLDPETDLQKYPSELSGGMQKRVGLARALILEPKILLFDEPTTGLDPIGRARIDELIFKLTNQFMATSVVITHDLQSALNFSDHLIFLYEGKIIFNGKTRAFLDSPYPIIQEFIRADTRNHRSKNK
jgi:phospholipid/cholesterol/gamma-HCH transport system ATP-binding protein